MPKCAMQAGDTLSGNKATCCDCCGKVRRDVKAMGRDANGDPDAPDMCFICRKEWETRRRIYNKALKRYVTEYELYEQEAP